MSEIHHMTVQRRSFILPDKANDFVYVNFAIEGSINGYLYMDKYRVPRKLKKELKKKGVPWQSYANIKSINGK